MRCHLPEVIEAVAHGYQVFVAEGEKDADRLANAGLTASDVELLLASAPEPSPVAIGPKPGDVIKDCPDCPEMVVMILVLSVFITAPRGMPISLNLWRK